MSTNHHSIGRCPACGKQCYPSRKIAKRAAKALHPGAHLSAYPCGVFFHFGNLPQAVINGDTSRDNLRPKASA